MDWYAKPRLGTLVVGQWMDIRIVGQFGIYDVAVDIPGGCLLVVAGGADLPQGRSLLLQHVVVVCLLRTCYWRTQAVRYIGSRKLLVWELQEGFRYP
jgi:hypothetical protein